MKNKFVLGLILGIFLIGLISASVTGYLTRGTAVGTEGYTATLQRVDNGVAIVQITTPERTTETVQIPEDKSVQVGDVKIQVSGVTEGRLFRRAGADLEITSAIPAIKIPGGGFQLSNQTNVTNQTCPCNLTGNLTNWVGNWTFNWTGNWAGNLSQGQIFDLGNGKFLTVKENVKSGNINQDKRYWIDVKIWK